MCRQISYFFLYCTCIKYKKYLTVIELTIQVTCRSSPPSRGPELNVNITSGLIAWCSSAVPSVSSPLYSYITVLLWAVALPDWLMSLGSHWLILEFHCLRAKGRRRAGAKPVSWLYRRSPYTAVTRWSLQCAEQDGAGTGTLSFQDELDNMI